MADDEVRPDGVESSEPTDDTPKPDPAPGTRSDQGDPRSDAQGSDMAAQSDAEEDEASLGADDESSVRQTASTITNVLGMRTEYAFFASSQVSRPPATGRILVEDVSTFLATFCASEAFHQAQKTLDRHGMVMLLGGDGTGRYMAAIALLGGWPTISLADPVVSFTPTTSIAHLAKKDTLKPGRCYLVHDMRGGGRASADQRFELGRLKQVLVTTHAKLVITADPTAVARGDFGDLVVTWVPPDGGEVFDRHLGCSGRSLDPEDLNRARVHATGFTRPVEVAAFVERLADGLDAAMHSQSDVDRAEVRNWFEDQGRTLDDELAVAAACFLHRVPERIFERCLSRLQQLVREYDQDKHAPQTTGRALARNRQAWAGAAGLITTVEGTGRFNERLVAFRSPHIRQHALNEIWNRYGFGLIQPMRDWIGELARDTSLDVRVQTAAGLALLAEQRWSEVKESFLDRWSADVFVYRLAAANTLSMMAGSELLAPIALETALNWSENMGPRRAMTAALALGGPLSIRYQDITFEQLWYLTRRGQHIRAVANVALSLMLAGVDDDAARAMSILRATVSALTWSTGNSTPLERRYAVGAVAAILAAPSFTSDELILAGLLRNEAGAAEVVGPLFAAVVESGPHHHDGVDLMRRLLVQVAEADDSLAIATRLGAAVFRCWPPEVQEVLIPQIERELAMTAEDADAARAVIQSFLRSIDP